MTALLEGTKACSTCGVVKPLTAYYQHTKSRDGHEARCIVCQRARGAQYLTRFGARTQCVQCKGTIPPARLRRAGGGHRTCSRACLLANIGLPSTFAGVSSTSTTAHDTTECEAVAQLLMARAFGSSRRAVPGRLEREIRATWEAVRRGQW